VAHGPAGRALRGRLFRWSRSHTNRSSNSIAQAISGANAATTGESGNLHTQQAVADRLLLIQRDDASLLTLTRAVDDAGLPVVPVVGLHDGVARLRGIGRCSVVVVPVSLVLDGPNPDGAPSSSDGSINTLNRLTRDAAPGKIVALIDRPISGGATRQLIDAGVFAFVDAYPVGIDQPELVRQIRAARQAFLDGQSTPRPTELHSRAADAGDTMVGQSPLMADLLRRAARAAQVSDVPILIYGESGTGKQLLAELIHRLDPKRSAKRFLSVNCSAISGTLAESTLFGHLRGAYTGATHARKGIFRAADGGTVLLDEIGDMDPSLQPKLLRVLQEGAVMPLGSDEESPCDVRVIAATNRRLAALVEQDTFRLDLYQRLNVITLDIPPLRERREDIPSLVRFFARKYAGYYDRPIESIDPRVIEFFQQAPLKGNVRELENNVRRMLAFKQAGDRLDLNDLPAAQLSRVGAHTSARPPRRHPVGRNALEDFAGAAAALVDNGAMTLPELVDACERLVLRHSLEHSSATTTDLAKRLGLSRRTLYNKIRKHRLGDRKTPH
jgi:DNA-binding NtrC family response regulator